MAHGSRVVRMRSGRARGRYQASRAAWKRRSRLPRSRSRTPGTRTICTRRCRNLHLPVTRNRRWSCTIWRACRTAHRSAVLPVPAAGTGTGPIIGVPTPRVSPSPGAPPASQHPVVPAPCSCYSSSSWWLGAGPSSQPRPSPPAVRPRVTIATLDQGLPDVRAFRDLDFSERAVMDRRGQGRAGPVLGGAP